MYKRDSGKIDMVILDMIMPGVGGGETYDKMKEINPKVKVLLASGYSIDGQASILLCKRGKQSECPNLLRCRLLAPQAFLAFSRVS